MEPRLDVFAHQVFPGASERCFSPCSRLRARTAAPGSAEPRWRDGCGPQLGSFTRPWLGGCPGAAGTPAPPVSQRHRSRGASAHPGAGKYPSGGSGRRGLASRARRAPRLQQSPVVTLQPSAVENTGVFFPLRRSRIIPSRRQPAALVGRGPAAGSPRRPFPRCPGEGAAVRRPGRAGGRAGAAGGAEAPSAACPCPALRLLPPLRVPPAQQRRGFGLLRRQPASPPGADPLGAGGSGLVALTRTCLGCAPHTASSARSAL